MALSDLYDVVKLKFTNPDNFIEKLKKGKDDFYVKRTTESTQILVGKTRYYFTHTKHFPKKYLFIFKKVSNDVDKWLKKQKIVALPPQHDVSSYNIDYDDSYGKIVGTDLNHAYWRIAMIKGMISEDTYTRGLDITSKAIRLASLSVLGRKQKYTKYENGEMKEYECLDEGDEQKRMIYKYIRYFCYQMMYECSLMLGEDFDCWRTDCIYYRDTPENRAKVNKYFDEKGMSYKLLEQ